MKEAFERLRDARSAAGYATATEAASAMGAHTITYTQHENGLRGFKNYCEKYARFYRVNLEWLLTGRGEMRGKSHAGQSVPVIVHIGLLQTLKKTKLNHYFL